MKQLNKLIAFSRQKFVLLTAMICSIFLFASKSYAADYTYYFDLTNAVSENSDWSDKAYAYYFNFGTAPNQETFQPMTKVTGNIWKITITNASSVGKIILMCTDEGFSHEGDKKGMRSYELENPTNGYKYTVKFNGSNWWFNLENGAAYTEPGTSTPVTYYLKGSWDGFANGIAFSGTATSQTAVLPANKYKSGNTFKINGDDNSWYSKGGQTYANGTAYSGLGDYDNDKLDNSAVDKAITFTLTLSNNKPSSIKAEWSTTSTTTKYYVQYWTNTNGDNWSAQGTTSVNCPGTISITGYLTKGKKFGLRTSTVENMTSQNSTWWGSNSNNSITSGSVLQGTFTNNGGDLTWNGNSGNVTATITLDGNGNITKVEFSGGGTVTPIAGMPFYPRGVYNETEFNNLTDDTFYYLVGHAINNGLASPEWQMIKGTDGKYTLDFTFNNHWTDKHWDTMGVSDEEMMQLRVVSYTKTSTSQSPVNGSALQVTNMLKDNWHWAGVRMRATFDPSSKKLTVQHLKKSGNTWVVSDKDNATYLPFVSLVGSKWKQPSNVPTKNIGNIPDNDGKFNGWTTTEKGWQQAWIQYNSKGQAVTSRDKSKVYFNTQWPPIEDHEIMFSTLDNEDNEVLLTSQDLTFTTDGVAKSVSQLKADSRFSKFIKDDDDSGLNFNWDTSANYIVYEVSDMWMVGEFKVWSGWSGARFNSNDDGAEWSYNWNWGHWDKNATTLSSTPGTVHLGKENGNMKFNKPTYFSKVYFFLDTKDDHMNTSEHNKQHGLLYFVQSLGNASILARSVEDYTHGIFNPQIEKIPENTSVTYITLDVYKSSNDASALARLWSTGADKGSITTAKQFNEYFSPKFAGAGVTDFYNDGRKYKETGYYYYKMTVTFTDANGDTEEVTVKSNPFYIVAADSELVTAQLVKATGYNDLGYDYITYLPGADVAYGVKVNGSNSEVTSVDVIEDVPGNDFYDNFEWTDLVLIYNELPGGLESDITSKSWKLDDVPVSGSNADEALALIRKQTTVSKDYKVTYTFTPANESTPVPVVSEDNTSLLIPTPRLRPTYTISVDNADEDAQTVTVDSYRGATRANQDLAEAAEKNVSYGNARLRHLNITAYIDKPNASTDLVDLAKTVNGDSFNGSISEVKYLENGSTKTVNHAGTMTLDTDVELVFKNQHIMNWLKNDHKDILGADKYSPLAHNLKFSFDRPADIDFYERENNHVTIEFAPDFKAPRLNKAEDPENKVMGKSDIMGLVYIYDNKDFADIYISQLPSLNPGEATLAEGVDMDVLHYKSEDARFEAYYAFGVGQNDGDPDTNGLISTEGVDMEGNAVGTPKLINHKYLVEGEANATKGHEKLEMAICVQRINVKDASIDKFNDFTLGIGQSYFFEVTDEVEWVDKTNNKVQRRVTPTNDDPSATAGATYVSFVPVIDAYTVSIQNAIKDNGQMPTGVENLTIQSGYLVGEGFIDMLGTEGQIFSIDGRHVYSGNGRAELASGVYVVATPGSTAKVLVK